MTMICEVGGSSMDATVATLGDANASTCSVQVAVALQDHRHWRVRGHGSFGDASLDVISGEAELLLVPAAYREIDRFIFDPRLAPRELVIAKIPAIVMIEGAAARREARLYHHLSLSSIADQVEAELGVMDRVHVDSNPLACDALALDPTARALTNAVAAEVHGFTPVATYRDEIDMPFVLFGLR